MMHEHHHKRCMKHIFIPSWLLIATFNMSSAYVQMFILLCFSVPLITATVATDEEKPKDFFEPSDKFRVVWNVPSTKCPKYGVDFHLDDYGIRYHDKYSFYGPEITLYYENALGLYPYIDEVTHALVNGGIPQRVNMTAHLDKTKQDIEKTMPSDYKGLAVIDWESWRPHWDINWGAKKEYRKESFKYIEAQHPDWEDEQIKAEAHKTFDIAARDLMTKTLQLAKKLRPQAKWGFYLFPMCFDHHSDHACTAQSDKINQELSWLYKESTGLYPSIYMKKENLNETERQRHQYMQSHLLESLKHSYGRPIYPYMKLIYNEYDALDKMVYFDDVAMCGSLGQAAGFGFAGVIIWSSSASVNSKEKCERMEKEMREVAGPYALQAQKEVQQCAQKECSSHGRCITATEPSECNISMLQKSALECMCEKGYDGDSCEKAED